MKSTNKIPQKPWTTTRSSQLLAEISAGYLNTDSGKICEKWRKFTKNIRVKPTSGEFLGMYVLKFSCLSILRQLLAWIASFDDKKDQSIFHPLSKAVTTPWKCFLRVPWWNTFQLGPKKPLKPLLAKNIFKPQIPKSHSQPSVQCIIIMMAL